MNSTMALWKREFPEDLSTAVGNVKRNIGNLGKVMRCITSVFLGGVGVALAAQCSACSDSEEDSSELGVSSTVCLAGGVLYGAAGIAVAVGSIISKIIITGRKVNEVNEDSEEGRRFLERAKAELYSALLPRGIAGIVGGGYGCIVLPISVLKQCCSTPWVLGRCILGGTSSGLYILDAGLSFLDLACLDMDKIKIGAIVIPVDSISFPTSLYGWRPTGRENDRSGKVWSLEDLEDEFKKYSCCVECELNNEAELPVVPRRVFSGGNDQNLDLEGCSDKDVVNSDTESEVSLNLSFDEEDSSFIE